VLHLKGTLYKSTLICFAVQKLSALSNYNQPAGSSVIQFEEVVLNLGESFHMNESVFIAPIEGVYEFNFNGYKRGSFKEPVLKISLRLNGKEVVKTLSEEFVDIHRPWPNVVNNFRGPISMHSLLKLQKGDRIDVFTSQGTLNYHDPNYAIYFSGKLLHNEDVKSQNQKSPATVYSVLKKRTSFNTSNSAVPFEVESLNVGGAFNMKTNAFIAPVSGIYEFTLKGYKTENNEDTFISLRLNGKAMANSKADWVNHFYWKAPTNG